jgi:hypothetical protein
LDSLLQLGQKFSRQIVEFSLDVDDQQPDSAVRRIKVNNSRTTSLASARTSPSNFPAATASWYDITGRRIGSYPADELVSLIVAPYLSCITLKNIGLGYGAHNPSYGNAVVEGNQDHVET